MGRFCVGFVVCGRAFSLQARCLMLRSPGVWYLVILFASLGLLSAVALDALRGRSHDHVLAPSPVTVGAEHSGSPGSQKTLTEQLAGGPSAPPATRISAFGTQAVQATLAQAAPAPTPSPVVAAPTPAMQAIPPWPSATVTTSSTPTESSAVALPRRSQECFASWDRETHMTKEEWKAACERMPRRP